MNKIALIALMMTSFLSASAAGNTMEEYMYSSGKIWVAIAVLLMILLLIFGYLWKMDKKLGKMEEESKN